MLEKKVKSFEAKMPFSKNCLNFQGFESSKYTYVCTYRGEVHTCVHICVYKRLNPLKSIMPFSKAVWISDWKTFGSSRCISCVSRIMLGECLTILWKLDSYFLSDVWERFSLRWSRSTKLPINLTLAPMYFRFEREASSIYMHNACFLGGIFESHESMNIRWKNIYFLENLRNCEMFKEIKYIVK